jgi:hypothetical protein
MTKVGLRQHHKPGCQVRWLSTNHQIARRGGNSGYRLVNKSRVNAGADQRHHPIKPANLLNRGRKTSSAHVANRPTATKSPWRPTRCHQVEGKTSWAEALAPPCHRLMCGAASTRPLRLPIRK